MHSRDDRIERAQASFIGMAIGDALGATVEFMTPTEIRAKHGVHQELIGGGWLKLKPGQVTDDTEMALCIARAVVESGQWDLSRIADTFSVWLKSHPVDCGDTCRRGIRRYMLHGTLQSPVNQWDAGNGGLMRLLPAVLFAWPDEEKMADYVLAQARITHNHPLSDAACRSMGTMLLLALSGAGKTRLIREADRLVTEFPSFRFHPYPGLSTGYVVDTMQTVLHYFCAGKNFADCLIRTVNQGGDADTTGAICGMLAGAYYGLEGIPQRWVRRMNPRLLDELKQLARTLIMSGQEMPKM